MTKGHSEPALETELRQNGKANRREQVGPLLVYTTPYISISALNYGAPFVSKVVELGDIIIYPHGKVNGGNSGRTIIHKGFPPQP